MREFDSSICIQIVDRIILQFCHYYVTALVKSN